MPKLICARTEKICVRTRMFAWFVQQRERWRMSGGRYDRFWTRERRPSLGLHRCGHSELFVRDVRGCVRFGLACSRMRSVTATSAEFSCDAFGVEEVLIVNERDVAAESAAPHKQELSQLLLRASASYVPCRRPSRGVPVRMH